MNTKKYFYQIFSFFSLFLLQGISAAQKAKVDMEKVALAFLAQKEAKNENFENVQGDHILNHYFLYEMQKLLNREEDIYKVKNNDLDKLLEHSKKYNTKLLVTEREREDLMKKYQSDIQKQLNETQGDHSVFNDIYNYFKSNLSNVEKLYNLFFSNENLDQKYQDDKNFHEYHKQIKDWKKSKENIIPNKYISSLQTLFLYLSMSKLGNEERDSLSNQVKQKIKAILETKDIIRDGFIIKKEALRKMRIENYKNELYKFNWSDKEVVKFALNGLVQLTSKDQRDNGEFKLNIKDPEILEAQLAFLQKKMPKKNKIALSDWWLVWLKPEGGSFLKMFGIHSKYSEYYNPYKLNRAIDQATKELEKLKKYQKDLSIYEYNMRQDVVHEINEIKNIDSAVTIQDWVIKSVRNEAKNKHNKPLDYQFSTKFEEAYAVQDLSYVRLVNVTWFGILIFTIYNIVDILKPKKSSSIDKKHSNNDDLYGVELDDDDDDLE